MARAKSTRTQGTKPPRGARGTAARVAAVKQATSRVKTGAPIDFARSVRGSR